jgi:hypothetical protein
MISSRWLGLLICPFLASQALAADWSLVRFESREYVTLDSIAEFYGFPKPPPVDLTGHTVAGSPAAAGQPTAAAQPSTTAAPVAPAPAAGTPAPAAGPPTPSTGIGAIASVTPVVMNKATGDEPSPITSADPPLGVARSRTIALDSGKIQLSVTVGLRECDINGVKHWLAFPVTYHDGEILVSVQDHRAEPPPGVDRGNAAREDRDS